MLVFDDWPYTEAIVNARRLVKKVIPRELFEAAAPYGHMAEAVVYNTINRFPARGLKVIGVTGTNGKTTTATMIYTMLSNAGYKTGLMTTVSYGVSGNLRPNTHMTTVPIPLLMKRLKWMRAHDIEWLVLETSSHALAQYRVWGMPYNVAVWTNLTHEHLDYHKTFELYREAKVKLFKMTARNRKGLRTGIVNADDPSWHYFANAVPDAVSYGLDNGDVRADDVRVTNKGSDFTMRYQDMKLKLHLNIPGEFNVYNALAAAATGAVVGLNDKQIAEGLAAFTGVAGRMEVVDAGQPFAVLVDYAVTPDALEKALQSLRHTTKGKIHLVFGATGDRDKTKRPVMGEIAVRNADRLYLTDDETYTEDPDAIRKAVYKGIMVAKGKAKTEVIADRREAIRAAFKAAKAGDAVLLTGIGHESVRNMGGKEIPWDEREVARKLLHEL